MWHYVERKQGSARWIPRTICKLHQAFPHTTREEASISWTQTHSHLLWWVATMSFCCASALILGITSKGETLKNTFHCKTFNTTKKFSLHWKVFSAVKSFHSGEQFLFFFFSRCALKIFWMALTGQRTSFTEKSFPTLGTRQSRLWLECDTTTIPPRTIRCPDFITE